MPAVPPIYLRRLLQPSYRMFIILLRDMEYNIYDHIVIDEIISLEMYTSRTFSFTYFGNGMNN
jgi:hypothetical protein